ncbi:MAG: glycosyltransferase family 4 protein [Candidatus Harrisonbacteria bacterium]|nr:glycosyltransferase family 4 protein [Candidatus Harrisonbacteria bacterium]
MRVCFLTHNLRSDNGAGVFSLRLIRSMQDALRCKVVALTAVPDKIRFWSAFFQLRKILKGCDIIHALDAYPYGVMATLAALGLGKKIIITAVGTGSINPLYRIPYSWLLKYVYRRAYKITAISHFTKNEILKKVPDIQIEVINHGVDLEKFQKNIDTRKCVNADQYKPYILSVGSLRWRKGYHLSIPAFARVAAEFPNLKYIIVGKKYAADYYQRLQKLISDYKLEDKVFLLDSVDNFDDLLCLYRGAELFCLLSQNARHDVEGFGLVFLEAAAAGLPVIGSKGGGIEDAVLENKNGFLVPEQDEDVFAGAVIKILKNKDLRNGMVKESLSLAESSRWDKRLDEYAAIYKSIIH